MFSSFDYMIGWVCYLLGAAGGFMVWWQMTHGIRTDGLREVLRLLVFALLFTPWFAQPDMEPSANTGLESAGAMIGQATQPPGQSPVEEARTRLAPAIIIALLEAVFDGPAHAMRGLRPILLAAAIGLLLMLPFQLGRLLIARRRKRHA